MAKKSLDIIKEIDYLYSFFKDEDHKTILNKLFNELLLTGWNVCQEVEKFNVTPHVFNDNMLKFYAETNAFIYECLIDGMKVDKRKKDNFIIDCIIRYYKDKKIKILCYGDGIGLDSQIYAERGYDVFYFDFSGPTSEFAMHRLKEKKLINKVTFINKEEELVNNSFDVIICREVLEHIEMPIDTIKNLWNFLKLDGVCFLSESFSRVEECFPTHLHSNLKYTDEILNIMISSGFYYLDRFIDSNLYVFKKTNLEDEARYKSLPEIRLKTKIKKYLKDTLFYYLS